MNGFYLFLRNHCKSRIFERVENFQKDCSRSWTKKTFQELVFKAVKNRKRCGLLSQQVRSNDQNLFFSKIKFRGVARIFP